MGGNMPENDKFTLALMSNDEVLAVNQNSTNNRQLSNANHEVVWVADVPGSKDKYIAIFNTSPAPAPRRRPGSTNAPPADVMQPRNISVSFADIGFTGRVKVRDLWSHKNLGTFTDTFTQQINSHGAGLYRLHPRD